MEEVQKRSSNKVARRKKQRSKNIETDEKLTPPGHQYTGMLMTSLRVQRGTRKISKDNYLSDWFYGVNAKQ